MSKDYEKAELVREIEQKMDSVPHRLREVGLPRY